MGVHSAWPHCTYIARTVGEELFINKSFQTGIFPDSLKDVIVHPLIKGCKLDPDILKMLRKIIIKNREATIEQN